MSTEKEIRDAVHQRAKAHAQRVPHSDGRERRRFTRFDTVCKLDIRVEGVGYHPYKMLNFSRGGICFVGDQPIEEITKLYIRLEKSGEIRSKVLKGDTGSHLRIIRVRSQFDPPLSDEEWEEFKEYMFSLDNQERVERNDQKKAEEANNTEWKS